MFQPYALPCQSHFSTNKIIMEKTYTWTYNVIKSCNNDYHFDCADALISLFANKYGETDMLLSLKELRQYKWAAVHHILM